MNKPIKKLNLNRETVKELGVKAGVRTGADYSIIAQSGTGGRPSGGFSSGGSRGNSESGSVVGIGSGGIFVGGGFGNWGGH
jgi:hypothetical protein